MSCDCNEKESNIPVPPPVVYETAGDSSSNHSLCDRTLSRIADLIAANKLPPSDKEVLNYVDPYEQQAYGYFENISKKSAIERENWANFYRHSTFQSRTPNPAKSKSAAYVYKATLIVPQSKTPLPMDINMVTIDGRCMIEM